MRISFKILVVCVLLLLGGATFLYRFGKSTLANESPPVSARQISIEEAIPSRQRQALSEGMTLMQVEKDLASSSQAQESAANLFPSPRSILLAEDVQPPNPALENFKALTSRFSDQHALPGWLYVSYRVEHPDVESPMGTLPNGVEIPNVSIADTWYQLDANRRIMAAVSLMYDESGQLIQVSVYKDLVWHNLTIGESFPEESAPSLSLDGHFLARLRGAISEGGQLAQSEITLEGNKVERFSYEIAFDPPRVYPHYPQLIAKARGQAKVDPDSGAVLVSEQIRVTTNGEELIILRETLLAIEANTTPPQDILAYLEIK